MKNQSYLEIYKHLGIPIKPLAENYTPDSFAKNIMNENKSINEISYAASTDSSKNFVETK